MIRARDEEGKKGDNEMEAEGGVDRGCGSQMGAAISEGYKDKERF